MLTLDDFRKCLEIDKDNLDEEFIRFPQLLGAVGEQAVKAQADRDWLKLQVDRERSLAFAELKKEYRGEKVTDSQIKAEVELDGAVQTVIDEYLAQKRESDSWERMQNAMAVKGQMLKQLAALYQAEYYSKNSSDSVTHGKAFEDAEYNVAKKHMHKDRINRKRIKRGT